VRGIGLDSPGPLSENLRVVRSEKNVSFSIRDVSGFAYPSGLALTYSPSSFDPSDSFNANNSQRLRFAKE